MAPQTRSETDDDAQLSLDGSATVDLTPVLEAQEVTDVLHSVSDADTEFELQAVQLTGSAPPLPLDALDALAPRSGGRESQPTLPGLQAVGALKGPATDVVSEVDPSSTMSLRSARPRHRLRTRPYGELEAEVLAGGGLDETDASSPRVLYEIPLAPRQVRPPAHARPDGVPVNTHGLSPLVERLSRRRSTEDSLPAVPPRVSPSPDSVDATRGLSPAVHPEVAPDEHTRDMRSVDHPLEGSSSDDTELDIPGAAPTDVEAPHLVTHDVDETVDHPEVEPEETFQSYSAPGAFDRRSLLPGGRGSLLALLLLGEAIVLPGYREGELIAPWAELASPGSTTFTAATFFVLLLVMERLSLSPTVKAISRVVLSSALVLFGTLLMGSAVGLDAFDGQPALTALFRGPLSLRVILLLCACTLPAALLWYRDDEENPGARTVIVAGVALVFFAYLALNRVGLGGPLPLSALVDAGLGSLFLGDRVASWAAFLPGLVAIASLSVLVPHLRRWEPEALAGAFWATLVAPLFVLALYVAPMGDWLLVLEPLQVVSTLAAGLLLAPAAFGSLLHLSSAED